MNNKQWYKETFDQLVMSEESIRKVKKSMEKVERKRIRTGFRVAVTMAVLAVVFVVGNVAVYAATGDTLVEKGIEKVSLFIDKKEVDIKKIEKHKDKNGNSHYKITLDDAEQKVTIYDKNLEEEKMSAIADVDEDDGESRLAMQLISRELKKEGKKIYLVIADKQKIDITKDFSDGEAKGVFKLDGETYQYFVSGTVEKYDINIKK